MRRRPWELIGAGLLLATALFMAKCQGVEEYEGHKGHWITVEATAYSPTDDYTKDDACNPTRLTSVGISTASIPYGIAVDPKVIPYGTRLIVPAGNGYLDQTRPTDRTFVADDTGSAICRGGSTIRIDLRYKTTQSAKNFGRKTIKIFVVED